MSRRFAGVELLEGRHMMAVVASFTGNQLSVVGDSAADTVVLSTVDVGGVAQVTVNGQSVGAGVAASAVTSIFANLGGGNDTMNLSTLDLTKFSGLTDGSIEIRGGAGNDTLVGSPLADILKGEDGNDSLTGGAGNDQLIGGNGNDTLIGGAGDDTLDGGAGDDVYSFSGSTDLGSDTIVQAASGNLDTLGFGSLGGAIVIDISMTTPQVVRAGLLTLTLSDGAGIDNVQGTAYDDVILGNAGGNSLMGNGGNDYLWGRGGNDWLDGGSGNDTLYGGDGNDTLLGKGGNDSLYGHAGDDTLNGNEGNDYLSGDEGDDAYVVTNYGTKTIGAAASTDNDRLDLAGNAPAAALDLSLTSVQAVATSLWVRFTEADAVSWVPGAGDNGKHAGELYDGGYYTVPGVEGTTTTLSFTYGGAVAAYHNPVYVYDADALQPGQHPSGEYLFTGNETAEGAVVPKSYPAGTKLGFYILQDGVDGFNGGARTRFYSENAKNTKDQNAEERQHVRAYDLTPTVLQLSWEDLFYVLPNPGGYRDTDFNDLWMGIEVGDYTPVDLDVDSDNIGGLERSPGEDGIEDDAAKPGVIVAVGGERAKMVVEVASGTTAQLTLANGDDKVTVWSAPTNGSQVLVNGSIILAAQPSPGLASTKWTYWIEANDPSQQLADIAFTLTPLGGDSGSGLIETVLATAAAVDLDIDSDNVGGLQRSLGEDAIEDIQNVDATPGLILQVRDWDSDGDGIANWADGFNVLGSDSGDDDDSGDDAFAPLVFTIPDWLYSPSATLSISYSASNPTLDTLGAYFDSGHRPNGGLLRIWSADASSPRSGLPVYAGGNFVEPSDVTQTARTLAELGFRAGDNILFVEAIRESALVGQNAISFQLTPFLSGELADFSLKDTVRITTTRIELLADNRDGSEPFPRGGITLTRMPDAHAGLSGLIPELAQVYNVKVYDPRSSEAVNTVFVDDHAMSLVPAGTAQYVTQSAFIAVPQTDASLVLANAPVLGLIEGQVRPSDIIGNAELVYATGQAISISYPNGKTDSSTITPKALEAASALFRDAAETVANGMANFDATIPSPIDGQVYARNFSGAYGFEFEKRIHAHFAQLAGGGNALAGQFLKGILVDNTTLRVLDQAEAVGDYTQVDVLFVKAGYTPAVGVDLDPNQVLVFEVKTSASGAPSRAQLGKLSRLSTREVISIHSKWRYLADGLGGFQVATNPRFTTWLKAWNALGEVLPHTATAIMGLTVAVRSMSAEAVETEDRLLDEMEVIVTKYEAARGNAARRIDLRYDGWLKMKALMENKGFVVEPAMEREVMLKILGTP